MSVSASSVDDTGSDLFFLSLSQECCPTSTRHFYSKLDVVVLLFAIIVVLLLSGMFGVEK